MKKVILFSFVCLMLLSLESFGMNDVFDDNYEESPLKRRELNQDSQMNDEENGQKEEEEPLQTRLMHPAFARYVETGYWGEDTHQYDHLSDLLTGGNKENTHELLSSRGKTFCLPFTSDRNNTANIIEEERIIQHKVDESFKNYENSNPHRWGNNSFKQDHNSDLFSGKRICTQSTRGHTFYISSTSSQKTTGK